MRTLDAMSKSAPFIRYVTFRHMKAEHIKKQADAALKAGNLREAYTKCVFFVQDEAEP